MKIKIKINKYDLIKLKSFCIAKEIINKMKIQPTKWEKIFANEATNKGLLSKVYKQNSSCSSTSKKQTTQSKNGQRDFPGGAVVENPSANAGDTGSNPGPGRSHMPWSN